MRPRPALAFAGIAACAILGCGGDDRAALETSQAVAPRRTVVWLGPEGLDDGWAERLRVAGVDGLVSTRGRVTLGAGAPVVRLDVAPPVAGSLPVAVALELDVRGDALDPAAAATLWSALAADPEWIPPAEIILDVPRLASGLADFVAALQVASALPVTPVFTVEQLADPEAVATARTARSCLVPAYGTDAGVLRAPGQGVGVKLADRLAPLAGAGVKVRVGISIVPVTDPPTTGWGDDLGALAESSVAEMTTSSALDRSFKLRRPLFWSGRRWSPGEVVAVGWYDVARLDAAFRESARTVLPTVGGWDLVRLPPAATGLGMGREALVRYLQGDGPAPTVEVTREVDGQTVTARIRNRSVFGSAVTSIGNWVEISVDPGALVAENRGGFDAVDLGNFRAGEFKRESTGRFEAVRFTEVYLAPGEEVTTGPVRVPSPQSRVRVRWHVTLSSGATVTGVLGR